MIDEHRGVRHDVQIAAAEEIPGDFLKGVIKPSPPCCTRSQVPASNKPSTVPEYETIRLKYTFIFEFYAYRGIVAPSLPGGVIARKPPVPRETEVSDPGFHNELRLSRRKYRIFLTRPRALQVLPRNTRFCPYKTGEYGRRSAPAPLHPEGPVSACEQTGAAPKTKEPFVDVGKHRQRVRREGTRKL